MMRRVQIRIDEELLTSVDKAAKNLKMTRAAFMRKILHEALDRLAISELEHKHRRGYQRQPVRKGEFNVWEKEQVWPDW